MKSFRISILTDDGTEQTLMWSATDGDKAVFREIPAQPTPSPIWSAPVPVDEASPLMRELADEFDRASKELRPANLPPTTEKENT